MVARQCLWWGGGGEEVEGDYVLRGMGLLTFGGGVEKGRGGRAIRKEVVVVTPRRFSGGRQ